MPRATSFQLASREKEQQGVNVFATPEDLSGCLAYKIAVYLKDITEDTGLVLLRYSVIRSCYPCESRCHSATSQAQAQQFVTVLLHPKYRLKGFPSGVNCTPLLRVLYNDSLKRLCVKLVSLRSALQSIQEIRGLFQI